jgi:hypothetical protein
MPHQDSENVPVLLCPISEFQGNANVGEWNYSKGTKLIAIHSSAILASYEN